MFILSLLFLAVLFLMWFVMAAPIGVRTIRMGVTINAPRERIWSAVSPFGQHATWNGAVRHVQRVTATSGRIETGHEGRDGNPIMRDFELAMFDGERNLTLRYLDDTSLDASFWEYYSWSAALEPVDDGKVRVSLSESDNYRGIAFLVFRFFAMRRYASKLKIWAERDVFEPGGVFEKPLTQLGMAALSALLMWPMFGLDSRGFFLAAGLTLIVAAHEAGHMAAFRLAGHKSARMIFIPFLGGVALGGRPYDTHFEVAFAALMGAGFSALGGGLMWLYFTYSGGAVPEKMVPGFLSLMIIAAAFNLGNLLPVWKADGGQIIRQVFRSVPALFGAVLAIMGLFAGLMWHLGMPTEIAVAIVVVTLILNVMTGRGSIKPRFALTPMSFTERGAIVCGFIAVFAIYSAILEGAVPILF